MSSNPLKGLALIGVLMLAATTQPGAAEGSARVLFVGGDWKAQLPNYQGKTPMRGYFVKQEVEKAAPGRFDFTLWTSYEFLQYGDAETLKAFDVVVVGDVMGQSVVPRLVKGLSDYIETGGGLMYCDNHKAFSFYTKELSFDAVLPVEVVPFRPYGPDPSQPMCKEKDLKVKVVAADHPIVKGLDFSGAPPLGDARYGKVKAKAKVIATSPAGHEIWVAWEKGKGRVFWAGGVFANDELSEQFAKWPQFGQFYAQALTWLGDKRVAARAALKPVTAQGTITVDPATPGPTVTAKHFGIHGQEDCPNGSYPMKDADLALYQALNPDGAFARTSSYAGIKRNGQESVDDGTDLSSFDQSKYDWKAADVVINDLERIKAEPVFLYWLPWHSPWPDPKRYTKYFAASIEHLNGKAGAKGVQRLTYFEIMNEPDLGPAPEVLNRYTDFYNYAVEHLRPLAPGVKFGCGGFNEWTYIQAMIDRCGKNLDWISRHPYGHTGEAVFALQDRYMEHAKEKGLKDLKFIITEWDFWIYGAPAFDYIMTRWKPVIDHADTCLGTLHYRWREYPEGGYVFGIHGEGGKFGELPPEWPNPGKDQPITYRYNAYWIMRDCRGPQFKTELKVPDLANTDGHRAYAVATCDGKQFNIVAHYGFAYDNLAKGTTCEKLKVRIQAPIPAEVKGRTLVISRADCKDRKEDAPQTITGDKLDLEVEIPAQSAISLTVK